MLAQDLYDFVTRLLGGIEMDTTLFASLVNMAKATREGNREWAWLKKKDSSITVSPGETFATAKTSPSDFRKPIRGTDKKKSIVLLNSAGKKVDGLDEIPFENQYDYQDTPGYFFVDYTDTDRPIYFTGSRSETYTAVLFYLRKTTDITDADIGAVTPSTWTWENFPSQYHFLLGYDVAMIHKGDVDYDDINARMVQFSGKTANAMEFAMNTENDRINLAALGV